MALDNTKFLATTHQIVSNTNEFVEEVGKHCETIKDGPSKEYLIGAATLLKIHNNLLVRLGEQNSKVIEKFNELVDRIEDYTKGE